MTKGGTPAPFNPGDHDVVSTKLRSWNLGHPGNLQYAELLVEYALKLPSTSDPHYSSALSDTTKDLVNVITVERGGRFLKIAEGENHPEDCIVMDFKACHHKVLHGLKNKQRVILTKGIPPKPTKITTPPKKNEPFKSAPRFPKAQTKSKAGTPKAGTPKPKPEVVRTTGRARKKRKFDDEDDDEEDEPEPPKASKQTNKPETPKTPATTPRRRRRRVTTYEAKQREDGTIHPYALELISYVCNHKSANPLGKPGLKYATPEEEPDRDREIRLQLRHRFFAAIAVKVPVVEVAKKLMEVWGGSLTVTSELVAPPGYEPTKSAGGSGKKAGTECNTNSLEKIQYTGILESDSSDESEVETPQKRKIPQKEPKRKIPQKEPKKKSPQKEPRRASTTPEFASIAQHALEHSAGATTQASDSGSGSGNDNESKSSSSEDDSDSESSTANRPASYYTSPYGFGTYYPQGAHQSAGDGQSQSENEGSAEGGSDSESEGSRN